VDCPGERSLLSLLVLRVDKQVNGLASHANSETDKTESDDNDDVSARQHRRTVGDRRRNVVSSDEDGATATEQRPAKVIAGEVIKQWQTKTRSKGLIASLSIECNLYMKIRSFIHFFAQSVQK